MGLRASKGTLDQEASEEQSERKDKEETEVAADRGVFQVPEVPQAKQAPRELMAWTEHAARRAKMEFPARQGRRVPVESPAAKAQLETKETEDLQDDEVTPASMEPPEVKETTVFPETRVHPVLVDDQGIGVIRDCRAQEV